MKTTRQDVLEFLVQAFGYILLLVFVTVSLYAFQNMPAKDRELILIMIMMSQQQ